MEITNLGKADGLPPVDWAAVVEKLDGSAPAPDAINSRTIWLSTVNEDGSPHVTAVGALWVDGTFWFWLGYPASVNGPSIHCLASLADRNTTIGRCGKPAATSLTRVGPRR
jgi:hypothetical protein